MVMKLASHTLRSVPSQSVGFSQRVTTDENFENMETQMPQEQSHESTLACQPEQDKGKNSNVMESGVNLLNLKGVDSSKYALSLLDALYSEEELKTSSFVPVGKFTSSVKPPIIP
ncbi:hypothetical protein EMCRGX_G023239 [Ephydatia muelleri]